MGRSLGRSRERGFYVNKFSRTLPSERALGASINDNSCNALPALTCCLIITRARARARAIFSALCVMCVSHYEYSAHLGG